MNGLGGLNQTENGVIVGLLQLRKADIATAEDLRLSAERLASFVHQVKAGRPNVDIIVFPEYSLNGASKALSADLQCTVDGPHVGVLRDACRLANVWACFSFMELNPGGNPYNSAILVNNEGQVCLHYRKLHPWVPAEPWAPGNLGIPVCEGPKGSKIAVVICHDGMFPEVARECAYKGAELMIRIAGYSSSLRHQWHLTAQADAFCNLMYTASVCGCSASGPFGGMGEAIVVGFDGVPIRHGSNKENELITAEIRPDLVREARRTWGAENNIYQLGHRGFVAVSGGANDCPYTYMQDLVAGRYSLPWEDEVLVKDGTMAGHPPPRRT
ncbi:formamidase [Cupriavidus necator]|uniref:Formamidase n=1 Tax=Cupriavidus necator (strain ATCC 17699 / DSM 428 / KCTC 22496 / NCIMB 10442 / H16 / Stanier 337) TaxID=381666 RepID=Q0JYD3_CUPNH|nr:formamidase [Cupriavidus necator]KUE88481.1 formamidase [Cupriavidus necator]QCC05006.1 formamidase [Cupriavidus necator H16]QQB79694.1 formamidase [Cupriavidus necator]WKA43939.1 formamidase [Cupriavidus necator]CAJ97241.1 aliphatic amidase [Cupriavidus necator H16]